MTGRSLRRPLTEDERQIATEHHYIIDKVIADFYHCLPRDAGIDLYGECALALMLAATQYASRPELQKFKFSTIAYKSVKRAIFSNIKQSVIRERNFQVIRLDDTVELGQLKHELIAAPIIDREAASPLTMKRYRNVKKLLTKKELAAVEAKANGIRNADASRYLGTTESAFSSTLQNARKKCVLHAEEIFGMEKTARDGSPEAVANK